MEWNVDMNQVVGSHHIIFLCLDALRYDVAKEEEERGTTPVLNSRGSWIRCQATGNFTFPAHQALFAGFFPCVWEAKNHRERIQLFFPENAGSGRKAPDGAYRFHQANWIQALEKQGYTTCCVGGVTFFDKRSGLGKVLPAYFQQSFWNSSFAPTVRKSTKHQVDFTIRWLEKQPLNQKIFLYLNVSAIHYPNYFYLEPEMRRLPIPAYQRDTKESHRLALRYVDSELSRLFDALREKGKTFVICCSDHGTCYGEDGCYSHGINHPMVNTIPYQHFFL